MTAFWVQDSAWHTKREFVKAYPAVCQREKRGREAGAGWVSQNHHFPSFWNWGSAETEHWLTMLAMMWTSFQSFYIEGRDMGVRWELFGLKAMKSSMQLHSQHCRVSAGDLLFWVTESIDLPMRAEGCMGRKPFRGVLCLFALFSTLLPLSFIH